MKRLSHAERAAYRGAGASVPGMGAPQEGRDHSGRRDRTAPHDEAVRIFPHCFPLAELRQLGREPSYRVVGCPSIASPLAVATSAPLIRTRTVTALNSGREPRLTPSLSTNAFCCRYR